MFYWKDFKFNTQARTMMCLARSNIQPQAVEHLQLELTVFTTLLGFLLLGHGVNGPFVMETGLGPTWVAQGCFFFIGFVLLLWAGIHAIFYYWNCVRKNDHRQYPIFFFDKSTISNLLLKHKWHLINICVLFRKIVTNFIIFFTIIEMINCD